MFQFKENIFIVFVNFELTQNLTQIKRLVNKRYLLIVNQVRTSTSHELTCFIVELLNCLLGARFFAILHHL